MQRSCHTHASCGIIMTGGTSCRPLATVLLTSLSYLESTRLAKIIFRGDIDWLAAKVKEQADAREVFKLLAKYAAGDLKHLFSLKMGNGSYRDKVEFNSIIKSCPLENICYTFQQARGYWVITFAVNR